MVTVILSKFWNIQESIPISHSKEIITEENVVIFVLHVLCLFPLWILKHLIISWCEKSGVAIWNFRNYPTVTIIIKSRLLFFNTLSSVYLEIPASQISSPFNCLVARILLNFLLFIPSILFFLNHSNLKINYFRKKQGLFFST